MNSKNLALRPYLSEIEHYCQHLDHAAMLKLILGLAQQVEPGNRREYLTIVHSILPDADDKKSVTKKDDAAALLEDIATLHEEVRLRLQSIEDGSYWEEPDEEKGNSGRFAIAREQTNFEIFRFFADNDYLAKHLCSLYLYF